MISRMGSPEVQSDAEPETLLRLPLGASATHGGVDEALLQDLLFRFPGTLPIPAVDAAYANAVPVCRELSTPAGFVDALYVNPLGRLTLAEFKLWRSPQARREVIGQVLDYAKELALWGYEDLQREVSKTLKRKGNVLYDVVRAHGHVVHEAEFVAQRLIVQPRVLARTEIIRRSVIDVGLGRDAVAGYADEQEEPPSEQAEENRPFWNAVLQVYSFADVTVEVPSPTSPPLLYVPVRNCENGLWFHGFLHRYGGAPIYFSDVVVRTDHPARSFAELRGASWAYNERLSHSGCGVTRYHLVQMGETSGLFGSVIESGFHEESIRMVVDGSVDATAIDSQVLGVALRNTPALRDELRLIDVLGPSTIQPVAVSLRLPGSLP